MPANTTFLYPATSDSTFDIQYYTKTHMPLVMEKWRSYGLKSYEIIEFAPGPDGSKQYSVAAVMTWENAEAVKSAFASEALKTILADVPNYSNKSPVALSGEIVGTS